MKAFISSEMELPQDAARRGAARQAILRLGHIPVGFEDLPARQFKGRTGAVEACLRLVRQCQVEIVIVDDEVTDAMEAEIEEARDKIGAERIFYYFTGGAKRRPSAAGLWEAERENAKLATFTTPQELERHIGVSIASFIDDAISGHSMVGNPVKLKPVTMTAGTLQYWEIQADRGDRIVATLTGNDDFYATLVDAAAFARIYHNRRSAGMQTGRERKAHHFDLTVKAAGVYYLMVRSSLLLVGTVTIEPNVRIY